MSRLGPPAQRVLGALIAACALVACGGEAPLFADDAESDAADLTSGFSGAFSPRDAPYGGFGGGTCKARRTPVVFLAGNGDHASTWGKKASTGKASVLGALRAAGWNDCELFGLEWLSPSDLASPQLVFHTGRRAAQVRTFLDDVRRYTGAAQVDLVGHSMGATVGLHALEGPGQRAGARRFVAISSGLRGLASCLAAGPANPLATTCGSENIFDADVFGFYPLHNPRMQAGGFRDRANAGGPDWYVIHAGTSDEFLCPSCDTALPDPSPRVKARLDVGDGHPLATLTGDETSGVGHYRARRNSGPLIVNMLGGAEANRR